MTYTMWKDVPVPFFMSVYFFNVLNPDEISKGEKPMLEQKGPYVYRYNVSIFNRLKKQSLEACRFDKIN